LLFKDKASFQEFFNEHYNALCNYIYNYLKDPVSAEDIVQETFITLWQKKEELTITDSLVAFVYKSCKNKALEYVRSQNTYNKHLHEAALARLQVTDPHEMSSQYKRLQELHRSVRHLPPKCRKVFEMHKFNGLSYAEIAEKESISVNTVENHMVKALKLIRESMSNKTS
jgi:RNA polymerase sigma-70 factor (ECF subfamily)